MQSELDQLEKEVQRFEDRQEKENKVRMAVLDRSQVDCRSVAWSFGHPVCWSVGRSVGSFVVIRTFGYVIGQSFILIARSVMRQFGLSVSRSFGRLFAYHNRGLHWPHLFWV